MSRRRNARETAAILRRRNANDETAVRVGDRAIQLSLSPALSHSEGRHTMHGAPWSIEFARASCYRTVKRRSSLERVVITRLFRAPSRQLSSASTVTRDVRSGIN